jgi:hypothetical protein
MQNKIGLFVIEFVDFGDKAAEKIKEYTNKLITEHGFEDYSNDSVIGKSVFITDASVCENLINTPFIVNNTVVFLKIIDNTKRFFEGRMSNRIAHNASGIMSISDTHSGFIVKKSRYAPYSRFSIIEKEMFLS